MQATQAFSDLVAVMRCLSKVLLMATVVARELHDDSLFLPAGHEDTTKMVLAAAQAVDMSPCYGRQYGFAYPPGLKTVLQKVVQVRSLCGLG